MERVQNQDTMWDSDGQHKVSLFYAPQWGAKANSRIDAILRRRNVEIDSHRIAEIGACFGRGNAHNEGMPLNAR